MKKLLSVLVTFMLVISIAGCGSSQTSDDTSSSDSVTEDSSTSDATSEDTDTSEDTSESEDTASEDTASEDVDFSVALVTDTGGIDDKSFNQGTWEGIQQFSADTGAEVNYAQSNSDADYVPNLSTFSDDGYNLIVAAGYKFDSAIDEVASNYPDEHYLVIDTTVEGHDNVANAVFAAEQGSFLVGVAAAESAIEAGQTKLGFVGGEASDLIKTFEAGYRAGIEAVDSSLEVEVEYVGDFSSSEKAQQYANKMYSDGVYAIYAAAGNAGNGVIKEAKERRTNDEDVWVIGVDRDQYEDGIYDEENNKSVILTSMQKRVDNAAYQVAELDMNGEFPGGETLTFDLSNEGVSLPDENPNLSDDVIAKVDEFKQQILDGEIVVPTTVEE